MRFDGDNTLHVHFRRFHGFLKDDVIGEIAEQNGRGVNEQGILDLHLTIESIGKREVIERNKPKTGQGRSLVCAGTTMDKIENCNLYMNLRTRIPIVTIR